MLGVINYQLFWQFCFLADKLQFQQFILILRDAMPDNGHTDFFQYGRSQAWYSSKKWAVGLTSNLDFRFEVEWRTTGSPGSGANIIQREALDSLPRLS